jgi:hypothetical protein
MPQNFDNVSIAATAGLIRALAPDGIVNANNVEIVELARPLTPDEAAAWLQKGLLAPDARIECERPT